MKAILPLAVFVISVLTISFSYKKVKKQQQAGWQGFALVELFTSEGCSSCPPADKAMEEIRDKYADKNVLVLGYHVDYWDRLGWKDVFGDAAYTARQNYYANVFNLNSIYTPQAIVNGKSQFVGSNKGKLISSVDEHLKEKSTAALQLKAGQISSGKIEVAFSAEGSAAQDEKITIALVQKMATNKIQRGENEGRTLRHINIVRKLSEFPALPQEQKTAFEIPAGLKKEDVFAAAFVQNKKTGKISAMQSAQPE